MDIRSYLTHAGLTQSEFAQKVGVTQSMVGHWINRRCRVAAEKVLQVEQATDGQVTRYELRPDVFGSAEQGESIA